LDSDAYRTHHLGIQAEGSRVPIPAAVNEIRKKGKVVIPLKPRIRILTPLTGKSFSQEKSSTTQYSSRLSTNDASNDHDGRWWFNIAKTRAETRAAGTFSSNKEGRELGRIINKYCHDMGVWKVTGRLPGRYKDRPHTLLPDSSIFDVPIDDREEKHKTKKVKINPIAKVVIYIPDGDYNMSPTPKKVSRTKVDT
jgi:hypothetical protein